MRRYTFSQVNVFSADNVGGNPLAVVHAADDLSDEQMQSFASWTNLSETTFLLPPATDGADYRVRIYTPSRELPFAGHPTLGSCHAWLHRGGKPHNSDTIVQECEAGLITIRRHDTRLEFAAPPVNRSGPLEDEVLGQIVAALALGDNDVMSHQWVDNGPGWCAVLLRSAEQVLALEPNWTGLAPLNLGVVGAQTEHHEADFEVRAFIGSANHEDPVTGSLNASVAQWLIRDGIAHSPYVAAQGTAMGRSGRVYLSESEGEVWVGGEVVSVIEGQVGI